MPSLELTNYGHRYLRYRRTTLIDQGVGLTPELAVLAEIERLGAIAFDKPDLGRLVENGLASVSDGAVDSDALCLRYRRNPLENIKRVVFEITRRCNLHCLHCRNAGVRDTPAQHSKTQALAVAQMAAIGVRRFDFIGGEVTRFGDGWLDILSQVASVPGAVAGVVTNGWFLGRERLETVGGVFADDSEYMRCLRSRGLTHLIFSIDGPARIHDVWRQSPGLYDRILGSFDRVRRAGLEPRVSLVLRRGEWLDWVVAVACAVYPDLAADAAFERLRTDDTNYVSNFIDVGAGTTLLNGGMALADVPHELLHCKNFYRPFPSIRIQSSGELSLCPLLDAGEGYGNVNADGLVPVLNRMQDAFVYRIHAQRLLTRYLRFVTPDWFGDRFEHICSVRAAVTLIARELHLRGIAEDDVRRARPVVGAVGRRVRWRGQL
jgi:hypothetical protein